MQTPSDLLILGAGAAGLMAAIAAAESIQSLSPVPSPLSPPLHIAILEKNPQPGIKILVCGGGRCNLTNAGSTDFLIAQFGRNGRFLTPALRHLDNSALCAWFARQGVPTHEEHHGKIYPDSNQARSIVEALVQRTRDLNIETICGPGAAAQSVELISASAPIPPSVPQCLSASVPPPSTQSSVLSPHHFLVTTHDSRHFTARSLLIAVGGNSYQRMGTTGDGYRFAAALGHTLITPRPAIVALLCQEDWPKTLQGLAVQDVEVTIEPPATNGKSKMANRKSVGDVLFTHFGLSGPAILNPSEIVAELLEKSPTITLRVDFLRHISHDQLAAELRHWQQHHGKKLLRKILAQSTPEVTITSTSPDMSDAPSAPPSNSQLPTSNFPSSVPRRLAEKLLELLAISPDQTCSQLTSAQIHHLIDRLKSSRFTITATRGFKEAMVTAGGVSLAEVDPRTMQSKNVPRLYLAGEVLDLTGPSGGYNLQLAFSTGHLAGVSAAASLRLDHNL